MTEKVIYRYSGPLQAVTLFALDDKGKRKTDKDGKPVVLFDGLLHAGKPVGHPGKAVPLDPTHPVVAGLIALKRLTPLADETEAVDAAEPEKAQPSKAKKPTAGAETQTEER